MPNATLTLIELLDGLDDIIQKGDLSSSYDLQILEELQNMLTNIDPDTLQQALETS